MVLIWSIKRSASRPAAWQLRHGRATWARAYWLWRRSRQRRPDVSSTSLSIQLTIRIRRMPAIATGRGWSRAAARSGAAPAWSY